MRAGNQETVLAAFEEEGWPRRIDDPLPPRGALVPKYRLHFTIQCLNQGQLSQLIRFFGDGTGEGVCWELREAFLYLVPPLRISGTYGVGPREPRVYGPRASS